MIFRKLSDSEPRTPGEETLLAGLSSGEEVEIGTGRPGPAAGPERRVRAEFLRYLLLGACEELARRGARLHEKGVRLSGALIIGDLDLEGCRITRDFAAIDCHFDTAPILRGAVVESLFLMGSSLPGLFADGLEARGGVFLRGARVTGEVRLLGATVGGNLECDGARLMAGESGIALNGDRLETKGSVFLSGATVTGELILSAAAIGASLECDGATLLARESGVALHLDNARIAGSWFWTDGASARGGLYLTAASIGTIVDAPMCWPAEGEGYLVLERCRYGAFLGPDTVGADRRVWLRRQRPDMVEGPGFRPQPWEQCASVLRETGHADEARQVLIEKERRQRRANRSRASLLPKRDAFAPRPVRWAADAVLGVTIRYGRRPLFAAWWLLLAWTLGTGVFWYAERIGAFKPNNAGILTGRAWTGCAPDGAARDPADNSQLACWLGQDAAASYPAFNPFLYSADTLLPIISFEMESAWTPDEDVRPAGRWARWYLWGHIAAGWALSLLAVAGFSGLVKSD